MRTGLVNLLRTRCVYAVKIVVRCRWHAGKLMGRVGLAIATMLASLASVQLGSSSIVEDRYAGLLL